ncbi:MAG TPA: hypothetical protein DD429_11810 [Clostridiaceae bacterium]|nr:hypothetical protein [Clostridiaceae bacterium]
MDFFEYIKNKGIDYNDKQKRAITQLYGPLLIIAGPGSGKTSVIAARTAYLIKKRVNPENILVITFTRAAANEMKERFKCFPGVKESYAEKVDFGTFHSTFYKIINTYYGRYIPVLEPRKALQIIKKILKVMGKPYDDEILQNTIGEISLARTTMEDIKEYKSELYSNIKFASICNMYDAQKKRLKCIDFDDMVIMCKRLLESNANLLSYWRGKYKYFMIDEFQDSSTMQFEIIKLLSKPLNNICVVGDDDQSIYSFRGALPDCLRNFKMHYKNCELVQLDINYRSTGEIVAFSHNIISKNTIRMQKHLKSIKGKGNKPNIALLQDENDEASYIADSIESLIKKGYTSKDFAVLYRSNIQSRPVIDELIKRNIPFNIKDSISNFFEHWVCRDITSYLKLSANSSDVSSFLCIANKPVRYIPKDVLQRIQRFDGFNIRSLYKDYGLREFQIEKLRKLDLDINNIKYMPAINAVDYIRKSAGYDDYIIKYCMEMNIGHEELFDIMDEYEDSSRGFKNIFDFLYHIQDTARKLNESKKSTRYKKDSITLSTIHGAKGLEFTCVFLIGLIEGYLPHAKSLSTIESIEEERRLFYVGATRAKSDLFITYFKRRHGNCAKASRFIEELGITKSNQEAKLQNFSIEPGMLLSHSIFGTGVVISIKKGVAEVRFNTAGIKHLDIGTCLQKKLINL